MKFNFKNVLLSFGIFAFAFGFLGIQNANAAAINGATKTDVTPGTQFTTYKGLPVFRLLVNNTGVDPDSITSLSPTPTGSAVDTLITLRFYNDSNNNGYVDQGDTDLGASAAFASNDTKQAFDITDVPVAAGGTASILITAEGNSVGNNTLAFNLQFALGADILMTVQPTGSFPLTNTPAVTFTTTVPSVTIADGAADPAAPHTAAASDTNVTVKQVAITAAAGTSDSVVSLAPTPTGTENDNLNISSVRFYIDSGTTAGQVDGTDIQLVTTPATYTADDTRTVFTFSSPVQVAASSTVNILMVYDIGAGVTPANTLYAQFAAVGDIIAGSGTALNGNTSTISDLITISGVAANIAITSSVIESPNTILVNIANPGHNLTSVDYTKWHVDVGGGGSTPLNPTSAAITSPTAPWTITLTFAGTPFSDPAKVYSAAEGLYVDATGVTDSNGDTNIVVAHTSSTAITDGQDPSFVLVRALKQDGTATSSATNIWYYYSGKSLRFTVTSNEPLSAVKACVQSITGNNSALTCDSTDFSTGTPGADYINYATDLGGNIYAFNTALSALSPATLPTTAGGYPLNIQLTDTAGNITYGTLSSESFTGVFGIDPKTLITELNNATTTDWSGILDFTSVSSLTFNANVGAVDVGTLVLTGPINLTETATITGLQALGTNMTVSGSVMRIDSSALAAFNDGATLTMKMSSAVRPGLVVKNNAGTINGYVSNSASSDVVVDGKTLGSFTWNGTAQTLTFTTTGFSEFDSDNTAPTNQDTVFATSVSKTSGATVTVVSAAETGGAIWFAPSGTTTFTAGTTMTTAGGTATSILAPSTTGSYKLYVIDAVGNISAASTATLTVARSSSSGGSMMITPAIPAHTVPPLADCLAGQLFSALTGRNCNAATPAVVCSPGHIFKTTTGERCGSWLSAAASALPGASGYAFGNTTLKNGSKGEAVRELQRFLNMKSNSGLVVDGNLGPKTVQAVKRWQKENGLLEDGLVGPKTKTKMHSMAQ